MKFPADMAFSFITFFHVLLVPFFLSFYIWFYVCMFLFNFVNYVFLLLCLCILIVVYALFCVFCFHLANCHSSATLTEVFRVFPQLQGKCQGITRTDGARPALFPVTP
jgi:hypothetical protein